MNFCPFPVWKQAFWSKLTKTWNRKRVQNKQPTFPHQTSLRHGHSYSASLEMDNDLCKTPLFSRVPSRCLARAMALLHVNEQCGFAQWAWSKPTEGNAKPPVDFNGLHIRPCIFCSWLLMLLHILEKTYRNMCRKSSTPEGKKETSLWCTFFQWQPFEAAQGCGMSEDVPAEMGQRAECGWYPLYCTLLHQYQYPIYVAC